MDCIVIVWGIDQCNDNVPVLEWLLAEPVLWLVLELAAGELQIDWEIVADPRHQIDLNFVQSRQIDSGIVVVQIDWEFAVVLRHRIDWGIAVVLRHQIDSDFVQSHRTDFEAGTQIHYYQIDLEIVETLHQTQGSL